MYYKNFFSSAIIKPNSYVDDILAGSHSLDGVLWLRKDLIQLLVAGGELCKWISNDRILLADVPTDHVQSTPLFMVLNDRSTMKILGQQLNPSFDIFSFIVNCQDKLWT